MKTTRLLCLILVMAGVMVSCTTPYRVATRVNADGSINREVYALADSAFLSGDTSKNPFLFSLEGWAVNPLDSVVKYNFFGEEKSLNIKASRLFPHFKAYATQVESKPDLASLVHPHEHIKKEFRWFYTYHTYTGIFRKFEDKGPVSLDNYLNKEEQRLFLQGDLSGYGGMNGVELNDLLDELSKKFSEWYLRSRYEIAFNSVSEYMGRVGDASRVASLSAVRDSLFTLVDRDDSEQEIDSKLLCSLLDSYLCTHYYSEFYDEHRLQMDLKLEEKLRIMQPFEYLLSYELSMPGELLWCNTPIRNNDYLVWKVDAYRFLSDDFVLHASSRVCNRWAFVVTLLLVLFAGIYFLKVYRKRM